MACTYDDTLPTDRDFVRFLIGDVDVPDGCFFQDEELDAVIQEVMAISPGGRALGTKYCAASLAWNNLLARLGSIRGDNTVGPIVEKMVGRLRLTFGGGRDNTLQEALERYGNYLASRCAELSSARPVYFESLAKTRCQRRVVKSSGEVGS